jgi:hypothetical protein
MSASSSQEVRIAAHRKTEEADAFLVVRAPLVVAAEKDVGPDLRAALPYLADGSA